jgi:hypothetical protein
MHVYLATRFSGMLSLRDASFALDVAIALPRDGIVVSTPRFHLLSDHRLDIVVSSGLPTATCLDSGTSEYFNL